MYNILYNDSVAKDLEKIPKKEVKKILDKIEAELPSSAHLYPELKGKYKGKRNNNYL